MEINWIERAYVLKRPTAAQHGDGEISGNRRAQICFLRLGCLLAEALDHPDADIELRRLREGRHLQVKLIRGIQIVMIEKTEESSRGDSHAVIAGEHGVGHRMADDAHGIAKFGRYPGGTIRRPI